MISFFWLFIFLIFFGIALQGMLRDLIESSTKDQILSAISTNKQSNTIIGMFLWFAKTFFNNLFSNSNLDLNVNFHYNESIEYKKILIFRFEKLAEKRQARFT